MFVLTRFLYCHCCQKRCRVAIIIPALPSTLRGLGHAPGDVTAPSGTSRSKSSPGAGFTTLISWASCRVSQRINMASKHVALHGIGGSGVQAVPLSCAAVPPSIGGADTFFHTISIRYAKFGGGAVLGT